MALNKTQEAARKQSLSLLKKMRSTVQGYYISAADSLAKEIRKLKTKAKGTDKYSLTIASKQKLRKDILAQSKVLRGQLDKAITKGTELSVGYNAGANSKYTYSFMTEYTDLDKQLLKETFAKVNSDLVEIQFLKTYGTGLTYSKRIWKSGKLFERDIRNVVSEGLARNRDIIDISEDIRQYVRKGKEQLVKRYGNIDQSPRRPDETLGEYEARVKTFKTRISGNIEYNSLRIVRSQIQGAIQDSNIAASAYVPSVQSFNWTLSPAHKVYSICEDIEAGNPWTYETFDYATPPHPNCMSYIIYVEISNRKFVSDLKKWTKNPTAPGTEYLNDWKSNFYDPIVRGEKDNNYFSRLLKITNQGEKQESLKRRVA